MGRESVVGARIVEYESFSLTVSGDWCDITGDLEPGSAITLALPDGVGALQWSAARYVGGVLPGVTSVDLEQLLAEFAIAQGLGRAREPTRENGPRALAAATFSQSDAMVRVWYLSDGRNVAKATYTCLGSALQNEELRDCEAIVRSIRWR
jgi:hypothetical protein